jgi:hypothetical protein
MMGKIEDQRQCWWKSWRAVRFRDRRHCRLDLPCFSWPARLHHCEDASAYGGRQRRPSGNDALQLGIGCALGCALILKILL